MTLASTHRVRRALSDEELTAITHAVSSAESAAEIIINLTRAVFTALLATVGESLSHYGPDRKLNPGDFAIPHTQWEAIAGTCISRADAFGARAMVAMELIDVMPAGYDDPSATAPSMPTVDQRPYEHELIVSREATDEITAASQHCDRLAAYFGPHSPHSPQYQEAAQTWERQLAAVFTMAFGAKTRITRDGPMSLLILTSSGFTYALIFHPQQRRCLRESCTAVINDDGHAWSYGNGPMCSDGDHRPSYPLNAPTPGVWSFHS